jgi:2-polyprenyl-6-methoxyphenol hydroxylase-like FAD-dependent oxidoreductase
VGSIVVCGGSVVGLAAAMMLAGDGHRVTVLERDPVAPPADPAGAWDTWERSGVAQFRQPHNLFPPFRHVLDQELPGTVDALLDAGCVWVDPLAIQPPTITDKAPRPGDDRFRFVTGRRPVVEAVLAHAADRHDGVEVRRGVGVAGLLTGTPVVGGAPHVTGIRTTGGDDVAADLVVDATGRRTKVGEWLRAAGGLAPYVESEDCGFVYHTRYFRGARLPRMLGPPVSDIGTISLLTIPGDNGTWSVTVWGASADTALKPLRDPDRFAAVVEACPLHARWVRGEPISDVLTMAGVLDRYRRFVVDGSPVATGIAAVGDAWACTNPSAGRGVTVGLLHAQALRRVVRSDLADAEGFVRAWDAATEARVAPFYWDQRSADRARMAEMDVLREGGEPPAPDPTTAAVGAAVMYDPDVFRGMVETAMCLAMPGEVLARPGFMDKVRAVGPVAPFRIPGPDRRRLLEILS